MPANLRFFSYRKNVSIKFNFYFDDLVPQILLMNYSGFNFKMKLKLQAGGSGCMNPKTYNPNNQMLFQSKNKKGITEN